MTESEIKAYSQWLSQENDCDKIIEILSDIKDDLLSNNVENVDEKINKIISKLEEELEAAVELGIQDEIAHLRTVLDACDEFIAAEKTEMMGEILTDEELTPKHLVFAKTSAGNFYVDADMKKVKYSDEVYSRLQSVFEFIQSGRKPNSLTTTRKFSNNKNYKNVIEYKDYQVRVYTKNLADNVICVIGIRIKKGDNPKSISSFLTNRCKMIEKTHVLDEMSEILASDKRDELLSEGKEEITKIMNVLKGKDSKIVETDTKIDSEKEEEVILMPEANFSKENSEDDLLKGIDPDWLKIYEIAKHIFELEGTINVGMAYVFHGFAFGRWLKQQKDDKEKGLLSELQIKLLEDLNIKWHVKGPIIVTRDKPPVRNKVSVVPQTIEKQPVIKNKLDERWMTKYNLAKKFYEENGHLKIHLDYVDPETKIKLGKWISNQRQIYKNGKMPSERIKLLEEIGMIWEVTSHKTQTDEIEILSLEPEEEAYPQAKRENLEITDESVTSENNKEDLIEQINTSLNKLSIDSLYKIQEYIKSQGLKEEVEDDINAVYQGLLQMNKEELDEFMLRIENDDLIGKIK